MQIAPGERFFPILKDAKSLAVMSDIHLGAHNCVLAEPGQMERLSSVLQDVHVDSFVFNGDMCDFALATVKETMDGATGFLRAMAKHCRSMVYVPGNHDHHSWLLANELHEFLSPMPGVPKDAVQRTERMYRSTFFNTLLNDPERDILIAYPNLYWYPPGRENAAYIFHHGHYCEELYSIVSDTLTAAFPSDERRDLEFIEAVNFGWVEFIWYQLGQAGKGIGAHGLIEKLYEQIRTDGPQTLAGGIKRLYEARVRPIVHRALKQEADDRWWVTEGMAERVANWIDEHAPSVVIAAITAYAKHKQENKQPGASDWRFRPLDDDLAKHCLAYITRSLTSPALQGRDNLALFFGHTHKAGFWNKDPKRVLLNDGGWIRGPKGEWPDAHVFLVDDKGGVTDIKFEEPGTDCTTTRLL
jgi:predicted phosphodiesterase